MDEQAQRQAMALQQRAERLDAVLVELRRAQQTLTGLRDAAEEKDVLVPIGAGVHVHARIDPSRTVVRPIGADYATEGALDEAVSMLEQRAKETQDALAATEKELARVAAMLEQDDAGMV